MAESEARETPGVRRWLAVLACGVLLMVVLGGVTRLTGSGLSITEWRPVTGVIPPLDSVAWEAEFEKYRLTPQFRLQNSGMTLEAFQRIYFWEYLHRLIGRLLGVALVVPGLYFVRTGRLTGSRLRQLGWVLGLGGIQGGMGWFMVKSGLSVEPRVSHFRLAAHLLLALALFSLLVRMVQSGGENSVSSSRIRSERGVLAGVGLLLAIQLLFGAFTAGLHAGLGYNTFPDMAGHFFHPDAGRLEPFWRNVFFNPAMIQFIHRWLGFTVSVSAMGLYFWRPGRAFGALAGVALFQFVLGVLTLLNLVPIGLAVLHQAGGCLLVLAFWNAWREDSPALEDRNFPSLLLKSNRCE